MCDRLLIRLSGEAITHYEVIMEKTPDSDHRPVTADMACHHSAEYGKLSREPGFIAVCLTKAPPSSR